VGSEHFLPLAQGTVELGLNLLSKTDDPELRKSCYGLFAALSAVLKDDMRNILPTLVEPMLEALQSEEGIVVSSSKFTFYIIACSSFTLNHLSECRRSLPCQEVTSYFKIMLWDYGVGSILSSQYSPRLLRNLMSFMELRTLPFP
jgi:hypothetical protein